MNLKSIRATTVVLALSLPALPAQPTQKTAASAAPLEVSISGPRLISREDHLNFTLTLTNRSSKPVAVRFPNDDGLSLGPSRIEWRITDSGGRLLPPYIYDGPPIVYCPVVPLPSDLEISILQPGEKITFDNAGDPSYTFAFRGKGYYRVTLNYVFSPGSHVVVSDHRPPNEKPEPYTPQQKVDMLKAMPGFTATSNVWQMYQVD